MGKISKLATVSAALALASAAVPAWSTAVPWCEEGRNSWKVSLLVHEYFERSDGGRGVVRASGNRLSYYDQGMSRPVWSVEVGPDGSVNTTVNGNGINRRHIRIKVAAGTGPREITTVNEASLKSFIYIPD
jgi:hypothetical protein